MEADIDEEIVAIDDVESKDDRVLHLPEEWQDIDIERTYHSGDT